MATWKKVLLGAALIIGSAFLLCLGVLGPCWTAWWRYGVVVDRCPAGVLPYLSANASGLGRGVRGWVSVSARGQLYNAQLQPDGVESLRRFEPSLLLVDPEGKESLLETEEGWDWTGNGEQNAAVFLPKDIPDGDYTLRVSATVPSGTVSVDLPLALYRPAVEHVLTDAPLYRPGQVVKARAVLLEAGSLAPTEKRPGRWQIFDPAGEMVYEEKGRTGSMGVTDTTFPLADDAEPGQWSIGFTSGAVATRRQFEVREFRLPRFTVSLTPEKKWWSAGGKPHVDGVARYSSGAPVQSGPVRITVTAGGDWPPPNEWLEPVTTSTDNEGKFVLDLPAVPEDLVGKVNLSVSAAVTEAAGESATGSARLLLSEDPIAVEAVTELQGGLVPDTNNRLYLRVTSPDGAPLRAAKVHLRSEWDARDPGSDALSDADAVSKFQIDPGQPVTVTEPALPIRPEKPEPPVELNSIDDEVAGGSDLALQELADRLRTAWLPCARMVESSESGTVRMRVAGGRIDGVWSSDLPPIAVRCLQRASGGVGVRGSVPRLVSTSLTLRDPGGPRLVADVSAFAGSDADAEQSLNEAVMLARGCASATEDGELGLAWVWETQVGSTALRLAPVQVNAEDDLAAVTACASRALAGVKLQEAATESLAGLLRVTSESRVAAVGRTSPASWPGFSYVVSVEGLGDTVLRMPVGAVPPLRLRFSEVVVEAGSEITLTALRGPDYTGTLPKELRLMQGDRLMVKFPFDPETRAATFRLPPESSGFATVDLDGARALLYVRPKAELHVALTSPGPWTPGKPGTLTVTTTGREGPVAAAVTLSGVDSTMAALAPLPAPDDWSGTTVLATSDAPAFGMLDAKALQSGQIAGDNALQATVLRITGLPASQPGSDNVSAYSEGRPDIESPLTAAFYAQYRELRVAVRGWEKSAGESDTMSAKRMVELWEDTLVRHPAKDPFGRPMHLSILPEDLRALVDPRVVVSDAKHLPEDIENWSLFVATEAP